MRIQHQLLSWRRKKPTPVRMHTYYANLCQRPSILLSTNGLDMKKSVSGQPTVVYACVRTLIHALPTVRRVVPIMDEFIEASNSMHSSQEFVCVDLVSVFAQPGGCKQTRGKKKCIAMSHSSHQWSTYAFCYCEAGWDNPVGRSACIVCVPVTWDCFYNVKQLFHDGFHIYTNKIKLSLARRRSRSSPSWVRFCNYKS